MKLLVLISICICLVNTESDVKDNQSKLNSNSVTQPQKIEYQYQNTPKYRYQTVYQPPQVQNQYQYVVPQAQVQPASPQYDVGKRLFVPNQHNQPTAMIIIAQPAYVPANALYGNIAQQLLHYFQTNPQAKYQLLQGAYNQPQYVQPVAQVSHAQYSHPVGVAIPVGPTYAPQAPPHQPTYQLAHVAQAAQQAAHQYAAPSNTQQSIKTAPAIITGFENFTPEQQDKIKAQLSQHFGPLQPLNVGKNQAVRVAQSGPQNNYFPQIKYHASQNNLGSDEFVPSQEIKSDSSAEAESQYSKI